MYSRFQLAKKYLNYYLHASSGKGYGVHSPFVYDFIVNVLHGKEKPAETRDIERYRKSLLSNHSKIAVDDFGAGSSVDNNRERRISSIARGALKNKKYASLLFRIASYYRCRDMVELGTSLGTTTAYLASAAPGGILFTFEGADSIADIAEDFFIENGFKNVSVIRGSFEEKLPDMLQKNLNIDLVFVDGNHREEPTWLYFETLLTRSHNNSIFIFDDIHWSGEMENVWSRIKEHPSVTLTVDLFFLGLVFFRDEFLAKQHFSIRF